jgi:hypothetical protein
MEWASGLKAACLNSVAGSGVKRRHVAPFVREGNQHANHPAKHSTAARHRRDAQDRTVTEVAASIPTLRSSSRLAPGKTKSISLSSGVNEAYCLRQVLPFVCVFTLIHLPTVRRATSFEASLKIRGVTDDLV